MVELRVIAVRYGWWLDAKGNVMNCLNPSGLLSRMTLLSLALFVSCSGSAFAKDDPVSVPKNAQAKSYGSGWECNRGYRKTEGRCDPIKIPPNAYQTKSSYGRVWECLRGFRIAKEACVAIKVPLQGYLASYGDQWKCNRGYHRVKDDCLAVRVPKNGYLSDDAYGRGWECDRGFRADGGECVAIKHCQPMRISIFPVLVGNATAPTKRSRMAALRNRDARVNSRRGVRSPCTSPNQRKEII